MNTEIIIRETEQADIASLETLYREAFTEEELFPLVRELLNDTKNTLHLSAFKDGALVGHIVFTRCHATQEEMLLALLGPMAVLPDHQKQGIGSKMIAAGFDRLRTQAIAKVLVLGDPNFYSRSGFSEESNITTPYSIPKEWKSAWQSISLSDGVISGKLQVPLPWRRPELWSE